jgi:hypothetical protein
MGLPRGHVGAGVLAVCRARLLLLSAALGVHTSGGHSQKVAFTVANCLSPGEKDQAYLLTLALEGPPLCPSPPGQGLLSELWDPLVLSPCLCEPRTLYESMTHQETFHQLECWVVMERGGGQGEDTLRVS